MFTLTESQLKALRAPVLRRTRVRLLRQLAGLGAVLDDRGPVPAIILADKESGKADRLLFGADGLPTAIETAGGRLYTVKYDERGLLTSIEIPGRHPLQFAYNVSAELKRITFGAAEYGFEWSKRGLITAVRFPDHTSDEIEREKNGKPLKFTNRAGAVTSYDWDSRFNLTAARDAADRRTEFGWDRDRLVSLKYPDQTEETFAPGSRPGTVRHTLPDGSEVACELDPAGELRAVKYGDGSVWTAVPMPGNGLSVTYGTAQLRIVYDEHRRPLEESSAHSGKLGNRFNDAGRLVLQTSAFSGSFRYDYDPDGLLYRVEAWGVTIGIENGPHGLPEKVSYPGGLVLRLGYGKIGRLEAAQFSSANGEVISSQNYEYNPMGYLFALRDHHKVYGFGRGLKYDADRLKLDDSTRAPAQYECDKATGNLRRARIGTHSNTYQYGPGEEPRIWNTSALHYDKLGNLKSFETAAGRWSFVYCARGLMKACSTPAGGQITFDYDPLGRRTRKSGPAGSWAYHWNGLQLQAEEFTPSAGAPVRRDYLFLPGQAVPFAFRESNRIYWLQTDPRGAVIRAFDESGKVVWHGLYESFGAVEAVVSRIRQPWRLMGHYEDQETGLYYSLARYYHPGMRSYLARDPRWYQSPSMPYAYAGNDPWNRVDPTGGFFDSIMGPATGFAVATAHGGDPVAGAIGGGIVGAVVPGLLPVLTAVKMLGGPDLAPFATGLALGAVAFVAALIKPILQGQPPCMPCALKAADDAAGLIFPDKAADVTLQPDADRGTASLSDLQDARLKADLADDVYRTSAGPLPQGAERISDHPENLPEELRDFPFSDPTTGFRAAIYTVPDGAGGDQIVVAYKGTQNAKDVETDIRQAEGLSTEQYEQAAELARRVQEAYPDADISLTGHSLGGGLAQTGSAATGLPFTGFNSAGVHDNTVNDAGGNRAYINGVNYSVAGEPLTSFQSGGFFPPADGKQVVLDAIGEDGKPVDGLVDRHSMTSVKGSLDNAIKTTSQAPSLP